MKEEMNICNKYQSPIDINTEMIFEKIEINYINGSSFKVSNNGYNHQFDNIDKGNHILIGSRESQDGEKYKFELLQFHFHNPSEHAINSTKADLELHLVHYSEELDKYLVVGIMINQSSESTSGLTDTFDAMFQNIPEEGSTQSITIPNLDDLIPNDGDIYTFEGSLTTSPYTEGVRWVVYERSLEIDKLLLDKFNHEFGTNCREIQRDKVLIHKLDR